MSTILNALGISGSLRKKSTNTGLLRAAQQLAPPELKIEIADIDRRRGRLGAGLSRIQLFHSPRAQERH